MTSWRDDKPTDVQLATLNKWGIDPGTLTKGEVSDLITQEINERRSPLRRDDWDDNDNVWDEEDNGYYEDHNYNDLNDWKKGWD